jgi:glycosyltransferase involved in cell wall biosynthesis
VSGHDGASEARADPTGRGVRRLRILFAGYSLKDPLGGGELSARALLTALSDTHEVEALCVGRRAQRYEIDGGVRCQDIATSLMPPPAGVPFHVAAMIVERQFRATLARSVTDCPPDLLLLQQPAYLRTSDLPRETTLVIFLHSAACYGVGDPNPVRWKRAVSRVFRTARAAGNAALLRRADLIVANSMFLRGLVQREAALESQVVPPFIASSTPAPESRHAPSSAADREAITFVGLDPWKGAQIALRIAEASPQRRFLFLDGPRASAEMRRRARALPNVTCLGWTNDMDSVFARTRLLLVPSIWEEPFGRLPVEAGAFGIPSIASARGGLAESVGSGGVLIDPPEDIAQWLRHIEAFDDASVYAAYSASARQHAQSLGVAPTLSLFTRILESATGVKLST